MSTNWSKAPADFWSGTNLADVYPRGIEQAIALKLPVTVVKLPAVTVQAVGRWLRRHQRRPAFPSYRSDLMGCLYADGGHGFIFVCGADEPEEQRFTLAHDTAHFLVDYWQPRLRVVGALGLSVIDVLDGRRPARTEERAAAVLRRRPPRAALAPPAQAGRRSAHRTGRGPGGRTGTGTRRAPHARRATIAGIAYAEPQRLGSGLRCARFLLRPAALRLPERRSGFAEEPRPVVPR